MKKSKMEVGQMVRFKGVRFVHPENAPRGKFVPEIEQPFEMDCILEKEGIAVAPGGVHCWVKFLDGRWAYGLWESYRLDSVTPI